MIAVTIFMGSIPRCARLAVTFSAGGFTGPCPQSALCRHGQRKGIKRRASLAGGNKPLIL
jgi:hypothetical protein